MDTATIINSTISIAALGIGFGALLGVASIVFKVKEDPKVEAVLGALPGANCGGCGYPGCPGLAAAIASGKAPVNACPVGGAKVAAVIAEIMGVVAEDKEREAAYVKCKGTCAVSKNKYEYFGISDCVMADQLSGGAKGCKYGCLGLGTCVNACMFNAIKIVDGVAVIDRDLCTACGKCIKACPKSLIEMVPVSKDVRVACNSRDKGKDVMANCSVGCIACKICEKNCPENAITVEDNIAHVDYSKCTQCGICVAKCPKKTIDDYKAKEPEAELVGAKADE